MSKQANNEAQATKKLKTLKATKTFDYFRFSPICIINTELYSRLNDAVREKVHVDNV